MATFSNNTLSACQPHATGAARDQYTFTLKSSHVYFRYLAAESAFTLRKKNTIRHLFHHATMGTTGLMLVRPLLAQSGLSQMNVC
ncbi:hypothetical protein F385_3550 [Pantoea agglomerans 299R]|nr:hypothetical protein F385_3550 [Pantoea agglomerans 299R]